MCHCGISHCGIDWCTATPLMGNEAFKLNRSFLGLLSFFIHKLKGPIKNQFVVHVNFHTEITNKLYYWLYYEYYTQKHIYLEFSFVILKKHIVWSFVFLFHIVQ